MHEAGIILHPSFASLLCILQELVRQELLDAPSLLGVLDEALLDEVSEGRAPFFGDARHRIVYHRVKQLLQILREIVERWLALRQFKCEAPERPDVHLGRIGVALGDFRRNPTWCSLLCLSILLLLREEDTEAQVSNLDVAVRAT